MLRVEPIAFGEANEELTSIAVDSAVGHRESAEARVFKLEIFVGELCSINALSTRAIVLGEVTALRHELGNDSMKRGSFVAISLLSRAQLSEILSGFRHNVSSQQHDYSPNVTVSDLNVEEYLRIRFLLLLWSGLRDSDTFDIFALCLFRSFAIECFPRILLKPCILSPDRLNGILLNSLRFRYIYSYCSTAENKYSSLALSSY